VVRASSPVQTHLCGCRVRVGFFFFCTGACRGRGPQDPFADHPSAVATSRFLTHQGLVGTGCRSVANWFLAAPAPPPLRGLNVCCERDGERDGERGREHEIGDGRSRTVMELWWLGMERRWRDLAASAAVAAASAPRDGKGGFGGGGGGGGGGHRHKLWRYFEMDCVLTSLREAEPAVDGAVAALAAFPAGKLGEPGTPHACLGAHTNATLRLATDRLLARPRGRSDGGDVPWMLKLKGEGQVDEARYRAFVSATLRSRTTTGTAAAAGEAAGEATGEAAGEAAGDRTEDTVSGTAVEDGVVEDAEEKKAVDGEGAALVVPRVVWMYWEQGVGAMRPQDALCAEGWARLNPSWEVRETEKVPSRRTSDCFAVTSKLFYG